MFNEEQMKLLNQELASNRIKTRSKGNVNLSYLEGFDIIETANRVFGFGNWSYHTVSLESVSSEINQNQNHVICYKAVIKVLVYDEQHINHISREDVGFGTGIAKTLADAHEGGAKEAITDSIKRAMRSFGNQFGNSLYNKSRTQSNTQQNSRPQQKNTQNFQQPQQQYVNNQAPQQQNHSQLPYQNQQDFSQLTNLGLQVMQQGDNLIVVGDGAFENKEIIKQSGFRWDVPSKTWYMSLRQAA